jgi:hypothetical protein
MTIEEGMTAIDVMSSYVPRYFNDFNAVSKMIYGNEVLPESAEHGRIRKWLWGEIFRFIEEQGFRRIFVKIDDETPTDKFPVWVKAAQELKSVGFKTLLTTSNHLMELPDWTRFINPSLDWWQIGTVNDQNIAARLKTGDIDAADLLWSYTGSATIWQPYELLRSSCGFANAYPGLQGFHLHEYWRWNQGACIIFYTPAGPVGSPAWEGARDGFDDAEYYLYAKALIGTLSAQEQAPAKKQLAGIAGTEADSIVKFSYQSEGSQGVLLHLDNPEIRIFRAAKKRLLELIVELGKKTRLPHRLAFADTDIEDWTLVAGAKVSPERLKDLEHYINSQLGRKMTVVREDQVPPEQRGKGSFVLFGGPHESDWVKDINQKFNNTLFTDRYPAPEWYLLKKVADNLIIAGGNDCAGTARAFTAFKNFLE